MLCPFVFPVYMIWLFIVWCGVLGMMPWKWKLGGVRQFLWVNKRDLGLFGVRKGNWDFIFYVNLDISKQSVTLNEPNILENNFLELISIHFDLTSDNPLQRCYHYFCSEHLRTTVFDGTISLVMKSSDSGNFNATSRFIHLKINIYGY